MSIESIRQWAEAGNYIVVAAAAIVGGAWAWLRFRRERSDQAALNIEPSVAIEAFGPQYLATFQVILKNVGKVQISARSDSASSPAYDDGVERIAHHCCLQLRRIETRSGARGMIDWFDSAAVKHVNGIGDINLLSGYENPRKDNVIEFWMEPAETYVLSACCVLGTGLYLAKITFIVAGDDGNFWTHIMQFAVLPARDTAAVYNSPGPEAR